MTIDYINGHDEFDGSLWFFDGKYAGHDDQIGEHHFAPKGTSAVIEFRHRAIRPDITPEELEDLTFVRSLAEAEPYLVPVNLTER